MWPVQQIKLWSPKAGYYRTNLKLWIERPCARESWYASCTVAHRAEIGHAVDTEHPTDRGERTMICVKGNDTAAASRKRETSESLTIRDWTEEAQISGVTDHYAGKRAHPRTTWSVSVVVKITSGKDTGELVYAKSKDVSLGGIGLLSRHNIPPHTAVEIWAGNHGQGVSGRVMHSTRTVAGYIIGVAFNTPAGNQLKRAAC